MKIEEEDAVKQPLHKLRRLAVVLSLALLAMTGVAATAKADIQDFYIRNNTRNYVWYIYVSPTYSDQWEEDVLGADVLPPRSEILIKMSGYGKHCYFDIKVQDENGYSREYYDVDLCSVLYVDFP